MSATPVSPPTSVVSRPVSEALLNEKVGRLDGSFVGPSGAADTLEKLISSLQWDRCFSNMLIKSSLGLGFGVVFSVLLFKRRAWPAWVGVGFGAGRAYEECNWSLKQASKDLKRQG
jgi:inner membrane organizing system protein 1